MEASHARVAAIMELVDYLYLNGIFAVAWFCLAAGLLALLFSFTRYRQRDRYFLVPLFYAAASIAAAVFLVGVGMIRLAYHLEEPGAATLMYRLALIAAPVCGLFYILMHMQLLNWNLYRFRRTIRTLIAGTLLAAVLVVLPPPLGVFLSTDLAFHSGAVRPDYGPVALVYFAVQVGLISFLVAEVARGVLARARYRRVWLVHGLTLLVLAGTPLLDMLREGGLMLLPFPVAWVGFALFHLSAAGVLATSYAELLERHEMHAREIRRLSEELTRDDLTGLHSRAYLNSVIRKRLDTGRRSDDQGALLFIDLDNFKSINDRFGHLAGDELLIKVARAIEGVLREDDLAARWGGDEFLVFLPGADESAVKRVADRLRDVIREASVRVEGGGEVAVTASIGHSPLHDDAVAAADLALFKAKETGKNRVVSL